MRKRKSLPVYALLAVLSLGVLIVFTQPQRIDLLEISTRIVDVRKISTEDNQMSGTYWLSNTRVIAHEGTGDGGWSCAYTLDTVSKRRSTAIGLTKRIVNVNGKQWRLSPDGKWFLWRDYVRDADNYYVATRLDGSEQKCWKAQEDEGEMIWLSDSRSFAVLAGTDEILGLDHVSRFHIYQFGYPKHVRNIAFPDERQNVKLIGCLQKDRVLVWLDSYDTFNFVTLLSIGLDGKSSLVQRLQIALPPESACSQIELSPDGQRLAWIVEVLPRTQVSFLEHWMSRLLQRPPEQAAQALFVSRTDGSDFHEIGRVSHNLGHHGYSDLNITLNGWLPGNQRLSFLLYDSRNDENHNWLYTVPLPN